MTDLRGLFVRAAGEAPRFEADGVRRVVARRRFRRRALGAASAMLVVAAGVSVVVSVHHSGHQLVISPGARATTSSSAPAPSTTTTTTVAGPADALGYPRVDVDFEAFRGYGRLAYYSGGALQILDGSGGPPRSVSVPAAPERISWSADGEWLAVQTHTADGVQEGQGDLYVVGAGSGTLTRVAASAATDDWQWSPTSDLLAVVDQSASARNGTIDVFAAPDFGALAAKSIAAEFPAGFLAWSPDGHRLLYKTYTVKAPFIDKLWTIDESRCPSACGTSGTELPVSIQPKATGDVGFIYAGWSADGSRLLLWLDVAHSGSAELDGLNVASVPADGGVDTQLPVTLAKPSWIATVPRSSRAIVDAGGDRIWDSHRQLDSCDLDTGACSALVVGPGPVLDPAVSPDGSRLAYVESDPDVFANNALLPPKSSIQWSKSRRLVIAGVDNQHPQVIAMGGVVAPRWTTDSQHLLFWRAGYIWLVDAAHPAPVAIAGPAGARGDDGFGFGPQIEQYPYILPGNDVWDTVAWKP